MTPHGQLSKQLEAAIAGIVALRTGGSVGHAISTTGGFRYACECGFTGEGIAAYGQHVVDVRLNR